jgi:hypothetical protein
VAPSEARAERPLYFVNRWVDFAFIGGLSIVAFILLRAFHDGQRTATVLSLAAVLTWTVNWPHFAATSYRLYHSRSNLAQYPVTAIGVPLLLIGAVVASFAAPETVAPWLVKVFLLWSPYHFSGQSLGITLIYARRAGFRVNRLERLALSGFIFGTFLIQTALAETGQVPRSYFSVNYPPIGLPEWVPEVLRGWTWGCGAAFLYFAARWSIRARRLVPGIVFLPAAAQCVWFVVGAGVPSFTEFVPFFHSLQYLLIAWVVQLGETTARRPVLTRRLLASDSARWTAINLLGGVLLFWALPRMGALAGYALPFATAVIISAVQIHHFFVDGVIWKLRNPNVSSPLLSSVQELTHRPAPALVRAA